MRITGSCGIRLACPSCLLAVVVSVLRAMCGLVPPLVPSGVSPLAPACLMFAAVCLDASPRHLIISCLAACRSLRASARASSRWPRHRCRCLCCCRPIASRYPPRLIDTTGGETRRCRGGFLGSACLSPQLAISSVRFGIGWRRGSVLASLYCPACLCPMDIIGAAC